MRVLSSSFSFYQNIMATVQAALSEIVSGKARIYMRKLTRDE